MDLDTLRTFLAVAEHGGLLAAARALGLPEPMVGRQVAALEDDVGVPLLARERWPTELTPAGLRFAARARELVSAAEAAIEEARAERAGPRGILRIAAPQLFTRKFVTPVVTQVVAGHPSLGVRIVACDELDPAIPWNYDAVIWIGEPPDRPWHAQALGEAHDILCATPKLLERCGSPGDPDELARLPSVDCQRRPDRRPWLLRHGDGTEREVVVAPRLETNEPTVALDATLAGLGVAHLPAMLVRAQLERGELIRVLPDWSVVIGPVSLLIRDPSHPPARVQALLRAIAAVASELTLA